jgi:hypothetical protein
MSLRVRRQVPGMTGTLKEKIPCLVPFLMMVHPTDMENLKSYGNELFWKRVT